MTVSSQPPDLGLAGDRAAQLLTHARRVLEVEVAAVSALADHIDDGFARAAELILECRGRLVVSGMGKSGFVAQKLSATFASTGTPSLYLHPAEALHGDLGRVTSDDLVMTLSNSGRTDELVRLLPSLREIGARVIAMTGAPDSPLRDRADVTLDIGAVVEACPLGLAPTTSTTVMMVMGDALAISVATARGLSVEQFARFHPGGSLGRSLMQVREVMRAGERNPVISGSATLGEVIDVMTRTPGRPGAAVVVDAEERLLGIFTDGDLRRLLERGTDALDLRQPITGLMAASPRSVAADALIGEALHTLREHAIDQVVVVDAERRAIGLLDVQDLLAARLL